MKDLLADWKLALAMGGAAIAALAMIAYAFFRPAEDPEEAERKRRLHLNQIGRIAEGQIVDLVERPPESKEARKGLFGSSSRPLKDMRPRHFVSYSYLISGVTYHTAQEPGSPGASCRRPAREHQVRRRESQRFHPRRRRLVGFALSLEAHELFDIPLTRRLLRSAFSRVALCFSMPLQGGPNPVA